MLPSPSRSVITRKVGVELTGQITVFYTIKQLFNPKISGCIFSCLCYMQNLQMFDFYINLFLEPMDLFSFHKEIANIHWMKSSLPKQSHIFSPTNVTLFTGKYHVKRVSFEVYFDSIRHFLLRNLIQRLCSFNCGKKLKYF